MNEIMDRLAMERALKRMANEIIEKNKGTEDVILVGIQTRGVDLAQRLGRLLEEFEGRPVPVYKLDPSFFRDDRPSGTFAPMDFMGKVDGKIVVLVDDVIYTGRTVRAAMDALMVRDRPRKVELLALIDRGHRELPIRGDFIGKNVPTAYSEVVVVHLQEVDGADRVWIE
ncbi:MAG: bifunctional pyr operon transcriptional regulator/uracil phosphoribosyltransferase PyrR [Tissierellia bacterium]|nr:bifunctional pyr operon transcriptional regulator/uracil phosphoribosyltransferase PyrR [Tissierellia bacterium]